MSEPFLAEIRIFGFNFAPRGWANCDGQILPIAQNQSLFSLLWTTYGGDGETTFGLPDMRGRTPIHPVSGRPLGQRTGEENHTITTAELPAHTHELRASDLPATHTDPDGRLLARATTQVFGEPDDTVELSPETLTASPGSGLSHNNIQPCLALRFCIAIQGLFPSPS